MMSNAINELLEIAKEAAIKAGKEVLDIYDKGDFEEFEKEDESPVTSADYRANEIIMGLLMEQTPNIPIMSEETALAPLKERSNWTRYWLIDPIDGTQEFIARSGDFAVNIALIENNQPVALLVAFKLTFFQSCPRILKCEITPFMAVGASITPMLLGSDSGKAWIISMTKFSVGSNSIKGVSIEISKPDSGNTPVPPPMAKCARSKRLEPSGISAVKTSLFSISATILLSS